MIRILSRIKSEPWAITREVMDTILEIAQRQNESPEAVAQKLGRRLENTYDVEYRDGIAILSVSGPLFRYANLFTELSGATSYDMLARDFAAAVKDPKVNGILLSIDSPGGEANGVSEFADQIYQARGAKPITAYVGGMGASAAYWIASAADQIVIADTAVLGSIGTVMTVTDSREKEAKNGVKTYDIVSSQSPDKRLDVSTDDGRAKMQKLVDSMSEVFIGKVARNRGTTGETVQQDFGKGGVMVGQAAVTAGLADRVGSFEAVLAEMAAGQAPGRTGSTMAAASGNNQEVSNMDPKALLTAAQVAEQHPEAAAALRKEGEGIGAKAERERIKGILNHEEAADRAGLAAHFAFGTDMTAEAAAEALKASPKAAPAVPAKPANALADAMAREGNPTVGADADDDQTANEGDALIATAKAIGLA